MEKPLDRVIHTLGWPLRWRPKYKEAGGSFIYPMGEDKVAIGLVVGLDTSDATFSTHDALQELKTHSFVKKILEGGKRVGWGAKTIPSGGYWSMPKRLSSPGMVICGDAAGMVNVPTLKGIHYAMHAGMYAAEAIVEALKQDSVNFENYERKVKDSIIEKDLWQSRNMRQPLSKGLIFGGIMGSLMVATKGAFPGGHWKNEPDAEVPVESRGGGEEVPEARQQVHLRQAELGLPLGQRHPRRRARTTSASRSGSRASSPRPGSRCARRRSTRSPTSSSSRARRPSTSTSPPRTACSAGRSPRRAAASPCPRAATARSTRRPEGVELPEAFAATKAATSCASLPVTRLRGMLPLGPVPWPLLWRPPPVLIACRTSASSIAMSPRFGPI